MRCAGSQSARKGGVVQPRDTCTKTAEPVIYMLWAKHLESHAPSYFSLDAYPDRPPDLVPVHLIEDTMIDIV